MNNLYEWYCSNRWTITDKYVTNKELYNESVVRLLENRQNQLQPSKKWSYEKNEWDQEINGFALISSNFSRFKLSKPIPNNNKPIQTCLILNQITHSTTQSNHIPIPNHHRPIQTPKKPIQVQLDQSLSQTRIRSRVNWIHQFIMN